MNTPEAPSNGLKNESPSQKHTNVSSADVMLAATFATLRATNEFSFAHDPNLVVSRIVETGIFSD